MEVFLSDWLNLVLRWGHMIAGIGWIGTSFYFIGLDVSLRRRAGAREGAKPPNGGQNEQEPYIPVGSTARVEMRLPG